MVIALLSILLISGCGQKQDQPITQPDTVPEVPTAQVPEQQPEAQRSGCDDFPNKLDACEPFSCEFKHPFTGELMEKKIVGLINGKCQYTEEMPNNGRMDCEYSESMKKAVAQYYRDVETKHTIDGKEVENPLQEAMDTGVCVISGY